MIYTNFLDSVSTKYLNKNCSVKILTNSNTGNRKYFGYVIVPQHVTTEQIKLNGIEFYSTCLRVEEAKNKPTGFSEETYIEIQWLEARRRKLFVLFKKISV